MKRLGFALGVTAMLVSAASMTAAGSGTFDQKLSRDRQIVHALNRLTFGPRPGDVEQVRRIGVDEWIRRQLYPDRIPESDLLEARLATFETPRLATWQILESYQLQASPLIVTPRVPLAQLLTEDQIRTMTSGTAEERLAVISSFPPQNLRTVLLSLTPQMLQVLPQLQRQVESVRQAERDIQQAQARTIFVTPISQLVTADERRIAERGTPEEKRALLMSFDAQKRRQVLRALPAQAVAGIPELRREALAARQPPQFVTQELIDARLLRAVYSARQLEEVLVDFWLNHFNVFVGKGSVRMFLPSYERDAIRPHVFGRFRDMVLATARHPAMLFYLDNWQSQAPRDDGAVPLVAGGPRRPGLNENYGRELMELHTLGVDGGYTQEDVIAVARAFTGWTIYDVNRVGEFQFNPAMHDRREKIVLGHMLPAGGGEQDGLRVIDILTRHPSTARFVARRLAQRFVADNPPQALVDRMAATFTATDGDLRSVLETMFTSREFMSEGAWRTKLKSPLEFVVSATRAAGADVTDAMTLSQRIAELGQPLYGKPEPTGYPNTAEAWTNTAGFLGRFNFANALTAGDIDGVRVDPARLPRKPGEAAVWLLSGPPSPSTRAVLEQAGSNLTPQALAALVIASPDFQRR